MRAYVHACVCVRVCVRVRACACVRACCCWWRANACDHEPPSPPWSPQVVLKNQALDELNMALMHTQMQQRSMLQNEAEGGCTGGDSGNAGQGRAGDGGVDGGGTTKAEYEARLAVANNALEDQVGGWVGEWRDQ